MKVDNVREIVRILMESRFYFELNLRERLQLVTHVLQAMENNPTMENIGK